MEHYVTLFDRNFLPQGLALAASLQRHAAPARLWVLCMDEAVEDQLARLAPAGVETIPLAEVESACPHLLEVKPERTAAEYCWTLTPQTFEGVWRRAPEASRVTYLDADTYLFAAPEPIFAELDASGKDALITEHAYAPDYLELTEPSGRFCVQWVTFANTSAGRNVQSWWRDRCLDWCFARFEAGKYGDQKYLDEFPTRFGDAVHILQASEQTLAPWNVDYLAPHLHEGQLPVLYHFQGFRLFRPDRARLYSGYRIGDFGQELYRRYLNELANQLRLLREHGLPVPTLPLPRVPLPWLRYPRWLILTRTVRFAKVPE